MLETVIVGGGLSGLALAHALHMQGRPFSLFEARDRLGGRILSVPSEMAGMPLDLGPTWFWPETQPRIARLLADLGLNSFPQHDNGEVLQLSDHDKQPETHRTSDVHNGARRVEGGMASLVEGLSQVLPADALNCGRVLTQVHDFGDHVELHFRCGEDSLKVQARCVVLAMPPRLIEERVRFEPPLDGQVREAMRETYTWMADQAKVMIGYGSPFWRAEGHSGNAFVSHEHVVLGEIFDACDASAQKAALGGFVAMPAGSRAAFGSGMPMLISSQLVQVFGIGAEGGEQHYQDWANEPFTCSQRDHTPPDGHPEYGHPSLRWPQWDGKLHFAGSETATYGGGYLEGALESVARTLRNLGADRAAVPHVTAVSLAQNEQCLVQFGDWVNLQRSEASARYRRQLHQNLSGQRKEQLTQRAVLAAMEQVYSEALTVLGDLPFVADPLHSEPGRSNLTPRALAPFVGFNKAVLDEVVLFNRGSCALSNFPAEHAVSPEYLETIARDLAAAWQEFAFNVNALLLAKAPHAEVLSADPPIPNIHHSREVCS